jgi:hypothetical protein
MKKIAVIVLTSTIILSTFSSVLSPVTSANENTTSIQDSSTTTYREVTTYEDFVNAKDAVSIDPEILTEEQLKKMGVNTSESSVNYKKETVSYAAATTKKWSKKISKDKIVGGLNVGTGLATIVGAYFSAGTSIAVGGGVMSVVNGLSQMTNAKGLVFGGTAKYQLVRTSFYELPKKKWVYTITWAKPYYK